MKVSIAIPKYNMKNGDVFLDRLLYSIRIQTFQDYEIVITDKGGMAENTNNAIKASKGDIIKIMYQDDYFSDKYALKHIADAFKGGWMICGANNNPHPYWTDNLEEGNNKLGSPSALTIENKEPLMFDENLGWLLDCDYYKRLNERYGKPTILDEVCVDIGIHDGQATNIMGDEIKIKEKKYLIKKYA